MYRKRQKKFLLHCAVTKKKTRYTTFFFCTEFLFVTLRGNKNDFRYIGRRPRPIFGTSQNVPESVLTPQNETVPKNSNFDFELPPEVPCTGQCYKKKLETRIEVPSFAYSEHPRMYRKTAKNAITFFGTSGSNKNFFFCK